MASGGGSGGGGLRYYEYLRKNLRIIEQRERELQASGDHHTKVRYCMVQTTD
jgi:hypothetical protein